MIVELILGLILLVVGGEVLVRHSSGLALKSNLPPLIVGLTVVSIGTSSPELFASLQAVWSDVEGAEGIAVGNVIGSNIANLGLALGLTAMISPMIVDRRVLSLDLPLMVLVTLLFGGLALDGVFSLTDGIILILGLTSYLWFQIYRSRSIKNAKVPDEVKESSKVAEKSFGYLIICIVIGCVLLYLGSELFISRSVDFAEYLGVNKMIIGVTVVAFGTSVPEIVASVMAALKGEGDIGIGNIVGSNIMNILLVLGGTSLLKDLEVKSTVINYDFLWMLGTAALLYPFVKIGKNISRTKGTIYVICYLTYIYFTLN